MIGLGLGLQHFNTTSDPLVSAYASRVLADGGTIEAKTCVKNELNRIRRI